MKQSDFEKQLLEEKKGLDFFSFSLTQDKEDAKDLVQDTILKALTHINSFDENTNMRAWLFTIMKNTFINNYRRKKRIEMLSNNDYTETLIQNTTGISPQKTDHDLNYWEMLQQIKLLPKEQKIPFRMINQGYKYKEIADLFQISIGTVKSRIFLARKKLMNNLGDRTQNIDTDNFEIE
jgi:RNA polymerase sigma-70 factor (ECF subfamily)